MEHVQDIMLVVGVSGFVFVAGMFVLYIVIARRVKKKRLAEEEYESE